MSPSRRFRVTVTQLPVTRSEICHCTVAYRPGGLSEVLTEQPSAGCPHYHAVPSSASITPDNLAGAGRRSVSDHGAWPPLVRART
jgi:hypothetical protein